MQWMRSFGTGGTLALFLLAGCATDQGQQTGVASVDEQFVNQAAESGMAEVALSRLAVQQASDPEVRDFAEQMVNQHSQANRQLMQIAQSEGISPPRQLSPRHQQMRQELMQLSGPEFDQRYMAAQVEDHQRAIDLYQVEGQNAGNDQLQTFAAENLPLLQSHLNQAQQINQQLGPQIGRAQF